MAALNVGPSHASIIDTCRSMRPADIVEIGTESSVR
jgi:hypothetical protein